MNINIGKITGGTNLSKYWTCVMCRKYFLSKEELIRHMVFDHKSLDCWYNKKHCKMEKTLNPSRRDGFNISFREIDSPGNELGERCGIIYEMEEKNVRRKR